MARSRREMDEERRRLLRRMEWVYVYAPPILALLVGVLGALFLAWATEIRGTTFWGRWAIGVVLILVLPVLVYLIQVRRNQD